jgi:hypothetical protein
VAAVAAVDGWDVVGDGGHEKLLNCYLLFFNC